jgi:hypothetical protein
MALLINTKDMFSYNYRRLAEKKILSESPMTEVKRSTETRPKNVQMISLPYRGFRRMELIRSKHDDTLIWRRDGPIHDYTQTEELAEGINQKSRAVHEKTSSFEFSLA